MIMPISDQDGYEKGHFTRVYQHLIKPACERAGFRPIRADDEVKTNYIVIDIIKKILESDIVICDLSSKNPNVMYELGIRQAFNKKSVLIKDVKTSRIFDIQGLRTIDYDENLRIDEVQKNITTISKTLKETFENDKHEINSIIQLLSIKPAEITTTIEISKESSIIIDSLNDISNRLNRLEKNKGSILIDNNNYIQTYDINGMEIEIGKELYDVNTPIGKLVDVHSDAIFVEMKDKIRKIFKSDELYSRIDDLPF
ncbi:hypothetical protein FPG87_12670 [Flavobacterium psychrophilum]|nr:hypothetical protein FPG87_12670 [Flavobacterium psychrophilum]OUD24376.1 hypothetical protein FPG92_12680 [Flavobacterium psychrophilum]